ncbi:MAG: DUF3043 domain-containing protein [Promicromonosporaceae bacterium]|nr:DUF3043 domain-containing protein [Promicromonosporaceae bacterium]
MILGKNKPTEAEVEAARAAADAGVTIEEQAAETSSGAKSGPTRKRAAAQAANRRPLVPGDRRAAAKTMRERSKAERGVAMEGMRRGDEKYLPARDRGPQRRYVREFVDARRNLADYFLPAALVFVVLNFFAMNLGQVAALLILGALYLLVFACIVDTTIMWFKLKGRLLAKFGAVDKGTGLYAWMRSFQLRAARIPKPLGKQRGNYPQ